MQRFWSKVEIKGPDDCWLWKGSKRCEYGGFSIKHVTFLAHRVAWALANGYMPDEYNVCHNCPGGDNPLCCNPAHLWLCSQSQNTLDAYQKGQQISQKGSEHGRSKLNEWQACGVMALSLMGWEQKHIGAYYGIKQPTVSNIVTCKYWNHLWNPHPIR